MPRLQLSTFRSAPERGDGIEDEDDSELEPVEPLDLSDDLNEGYRAVGHQKVTRKRHQYQSGRQRHSEPLDESHPGELISHLRKRRKHGHALDDPNEEIPSPSGSSDENILSRQDRDASKVDQINDHADHDEGSDEGVSDGGDNDLVSSEPNSPTLRSRFRTPRPQKSASHTTKPFFKVPAVQLLASEKTTNSLLLPETFSPSRRQGRHDYVPGGAAETVRSWILGLTATETKQSLDETRQIEVRHARLDRTRRCVVVTTTTDERWLLVNHRGGRMEPAADSLDDISAVQEGSIVLIKGTSTNWKIPPYMELTGGVRTLTKELNVAVLWEIQSRGITPDAQ